MIIFLSNTKEFLNDKGSAVKWISHAVKKPIYLQELLWLRLGNYFSVQKTVKYFC